MILVCVKRDRTITANWKKSIITIFVLSFFFSYVDLAFGHFLWPLPLGAGASMVPSQGC